MAAEPGSVGAQLAALKAASGLTWGELAQTVGASSGDYVRKIAAGVKPGRNLADNVAELLRVGRVARPAPQRVTREGTPARVRAPRAAPEPSRVPEPRRHFTAPPRELYRGTDGKMKWRQPVTAPTSEGAGREKAREAVMDAVRRAAKGKKHIAFILHTKGGRQTMLGGKGGYSASRALAGMKMEGDDPFAWFIDQGASHYMLGDLDAADIVGVDTYTL